MTETRNYDLALLAVYGVVYCLLTAMTVLA